MSTQPPTEPLAYAPKRAATLLDLHPNTVYGLLKSGRLRSVRIGRAYRIPATAIEEFMSEEPA